MLPDCELADAALLPAISSVDVHCTPFGSESAASPLVTEAEESKLMGEPRREDSEQSVTVVTTVDVLVVVMAD